MKELLEIQAINSAVVRLKNGEDVGNISSELGYEVTKLQLNYLIKLYIDGKCQSEIETLLSDINYHSILKEIKQFNQSIEKLYNE